MDVRPGGKWSLRQTGRDGVEHRFWGEFKQIEAPTRLVMTQGFDGHEAVDVTVILTSQWGRTLMTRTMIFPSNAYRDGVLGSDFERHTAASYDLLAKVAAAVVA
jgi:uncharacterized protein YndB with AHSA1/START domain